METTRNRETRRHASTITPTNIYIIYVRAWCRFTDQRDFNLLRARLLYADVLHFPGFCAYGAKRKLGWNLSFFFIERVHVRLRRIANRQMDFYYEMVGIIYEWREYNAIEYSSRLWIVSLEYTMIPFNFNSLTANHRVNCDAILYRRYNKIK